MEGSLRPDLEGAAFESYLRLCSDYLKRQILVYRNWPQRRWAETGYLDGKVFRDRNA